MENNTMIFDLKSAEEATWLANMVSEFQTKGVKFIVEKDANLVYVTLK